MGQHLSKRGLSHRWLYRPKRTRARAADKFRECIERARRGEQFAPPVPPEGWERVRRILGGNFAGEELLDHMFQNNEYWESQACAVIATDRMLRTAIAIRVRKLETGSYPKSLIALVPDLLPKLPRDPEDPNGGALRWDPDRGVLWTLGPDRMDQGGRVPGARRRGSLLSSNRRGNNPIFFEPTHDPQRKDRALLLR